MARKVLTYGTVLVAMYLVGSAASNWGRLLKQGGETTRTVVRTFQGK